MSVSVAKIYDLMLFMTFQLCFRIPFLLLLLFLHYLPRMDKNVCAPVEVHYASWRGERLLVLFIDLFITLLEFEQPLYVGMHYRPLTLVKDFRHQLDCSNHHSSRLGMRFGVTTMTAQCSLKCGTSIGEKKINCHA